MQLNVCEIFYSLQGESTFTGLPCSFIRLSGCNLDCAWCDTGYAKTKAVPMTVGQILETIESHHCGLVEVTGGEPLLQKNTPALISALLEKNYQVLLETNGSKSIEPLHPGCIKIVDIKCPSSTEQNSFLMENIDFLTDRDEIKFVIGSKEDYQFATRFIRTNLSKISPHHIHLSPVFGQILPADIAAWMMADHLGARLSLQQHKIIWDPDKRGV